MVPTLGIQRQHVPVQDLRRRCSQPPQVATGQVEPVKGLPRLEWMVCPPRCDLLVRWSPGCFQSYTSAASGSNEVEQQARMPAACCESRRLAGKQSRIQTQPGGKLTDERRRSQPHGTKPPFF